MHFCKSKCDISLRYDLRFTLYFFVKINPVELSEKLHSLSFVYFLISKLINMPIFYMLCHISIISVAEG